MLEIIIITYKCAQLALNCIASIPQAVGNYEYNVIVVDNASGDDTVETIKNRYPNINIIENRANLGYSKAVNIGVNATNSKLLFISNADVEFFPHSLKLLADYLNSNDNIGVVGARQEYPDGSWQYCYGDLPGIWTALKDLFLISNVQRFLRRKFYKKFDYEKTKSAGYIDGACIGVKKADFDAVGGFDEDYFFYAEEADFCYKIQNLLNKKCMFYPKAKIMHVRGGSTASAQVSEKTLRALCSAKALFAQKRRSKFEKFAYVKLQKFQSRILLFIFNIIYIINKKDRFKNKINYYSTLSKVWSEFE